MIEKLSISKWNGIDLYISPNAFKPKNSTLMIYEEIDKALESFDTKVPIIDLCCGIGTIGICAIVTRPDLFDSFHGFDKDTESIKVCYHNLRLHNIKGQASLWKAGEGLPQLKTGIVVFNPPFLSKSSLKGLSASKESLIYSNNEGLDVLLKCFKSLEGTHHIIILKSLKNQVPQISNLVKRKYKLHRLVQYKIEKDYTIAFTTWKQIQNSELKSNIL